MKMTNKTKQTQANILLTLTSQYCDKKKEYYYIVQARMRDMTAVKKSRPTKVYTASARLPDNASHLVFRQIIKDLTDLEYQTKEKE